METERKAKRGKKGHVALPVPVEQQKGEHAAL